MGLFDWFRRDKRNLENPTFDLNDPNAWAEHFGGEFSTGYRLAHLT